MQYRCAARFIPSAWARVARWSSHHLQLVRLAAKIRLKCQQRIRFAKGAAMLSHLDHLVITTRDKSRCVDFYSRILGAD